MEEAKRKLIINYLPQTMVEQTLHNMFAPFGSIESVHIVRDKQTNYSFGYGFVTFQNEESGNRAIDHLNGMEIAGKRLKVSWSRIPGEKKTNLYVTNLPKNFTVRDIDELFGPYGNIVQRAVLLDKFTQMPRGVAFVRYSRDEEATSALADLSGKILPGCVEALHIKIAEDHSKMKAAYYTGLQQGQRIGRGRGFIGYRGGRGGMGGIGPMKSHLPMYSRFNNQF